MLLIFLNSMFLASYDYDDRDDTTLRNKALNLGGQIFTILFTAEGLCKVMARGLCMHHNSYLRNGWNWLDFLVILAGWVEIIPGIPNFRAARTFRVLRPLGAINSIPSLKNQVVTLMRSLSQLVNVVLFLIFLFMLFAIFGNLVFFGRFYQKCRTQEFPIDGNWPSDES